MGEESTRAASVDAGRALELASFALRIAERVSGDEGWLCQVFVWAFMANARRVRTTSAERVGFASSVRL